MTSRLPKRTRINGQLWRVQPKRTVLLDGEECEGLCHFNEQVIEISVKSEDDFTIQATFWHEVLHAAFHMSGIQSISDDAEHAIIGVLERYLAANVDFRKQARKSKIKVNKGS